MGPALRWPCVLAAVAHAVLRDSCKAGTIVHAKNPAYVGQGLATSMGGIGADELGNRDQEQEASSAGHSRNAEVVNVGSNSLGLIWVGSSSPHPNQVNPAFVTDSQGNPCLTPDEPDSGGGGGGGAA